MIQQSNNLYAKFGQILRTKISKMHLGMPTIQSQRYQKCLVTNVHNYNF